MSNASTNVRDGFVVVFLGVSVAAGIAHLARGIVHIARPAFGKRYPRRTA